MKDSEFRARLDKQDEKRSSILKRHTELKAKYDEEKARNPRSPKLRSILQKLEESEKEFQANRAETERIVRERLTRKQ